MIIILRYFFVIFSSVFSIYCLCSCIKRFIKIKELPNDILGKFNKESYLKTLQKYCIICGSASLLSFACLFSPIMELRAVIPIISIIISNYILQNLLDEIEDFNLSKKDTDILKEFLSRSRKEAKEKAKSNKIKKVDSEDILKSNKDE